MNLAETRSHIPIVHQKAVKSKKRPIPKVSKKMVGLKRQYMKLREEYLLSHPYCEYFQNFNELRRSTEIHHKKGRGKFLLDTSTFMAVCEQAHKEIHFNTEESYKRGWMLPRR